MSITFLPPFIFPAYKYNTEITKVAEITEQAFKM